MLEVYFKSNQEVISFCESLFYYHKEIDLKWKTNEEWGYHLTFTGKKLADNEIQAVERSMVDVFLRHRLSELINEIITRKYYYTNADEIERISELTHIIFREIDEGVYQTVKKTSPSQLLLSLFAANMKNTNIIHFDSICQFQLTMFKDQLVHHIGLAIDEFKQEEDHQTFIDMLRKYIDKRESTHLEVHIIQGDSFIFYHPTGEQFSTLALRNIVHNEPLYIVGLDVEELNLAPLIAMSPQKIYLYGDNPSEPKTMTVINVFQEKVVFQPISNFPFPRYLDMK
ncbi:MAG TPA: putative sporulation protein YtxC [Virgibacillus sp.]|nr:putative sporulation protein YtxC [Virgibacillus sp.]